MKDGEGGGQKRKENEERDSRSVMACSVLPAMAQNEEWCGVYEERERERESKAISLCVTEKYAEERNKARTQQRHDTPSQ